MYDPHLHLRQNPADRWLFRWVFDFGFKMRIGGWFPASRLEDMASTVNKEGLLFAYIEAKHWSTREVRRVAECKGEDFINFEHLTACMLNSERVVHHTYGMRIQCRNEVITALEDGTVLHEPRQLDGSYIYPEWTRF